MNDDDTQESFENFLNRNYPAMTNYKLVGIEEYKRLKWIEAKAKSHLEVAKQTVELYKEKKYVG